MSGIKHCEMAQSARSALPWLDKVFKFQSHPKVSDGSCDLHTVLSQLMSHWHHPAVSAEDWVLEGNTETCPSIEVTENNSACQNPPPKNDWSFWRPQLTPLSSKNTTLWNARAGFCAGFPKECPHPAMGGSSELVCWGSAGRAALFAQWSLGWLSLPGRRPGKFKCCEVFMHLQLKNISASTFKT